MNILRKLRPPDRQATSSMDYKGLFMVAKSSALVMALLSATTVGAQETDIQALGDSYLKQGKPNKNQGASSFLRVRSSGKNRAVVRFDQTTIVSAVGAGRLVSASLELYIESNGDNWGAGGRTVDAHRLQAGWSEQGVTWNCPEDEQPGNSAADCEAQWDGGAFAAEPTDTIVHTNGLSGWIGFDVTGDVLEFLGGSPNHGWLLKKTDEGQSGKVEYTSRDGVVGQAARLMLVVESMEFDEVPPQIAVVGPGRIVVNDATPGIDIEYSDGGAGVDPASLQVVLDGLDISSGCAVGAASAACEPPTLESGLHTVSVSLADHFGNTAEAILEFELLVGGGMHQTDFAVADDTYLRSGHPNQNQGAEPILRVRSSGHNRSLLEFDEVAIEELLGDAAIESAVLKLTIINNGGNWGANGRSIGLHRLLEAWSDEGATWNCGFDADTGNQQPDCVAQWDGGAFESEPSSTVLLTSTSTGVVELDVTSDLVAILEGAANHGWLIKKTEEGQAGLVEFGSSAGLEEAAPRVEVVFENPGEEDSEPPLLTISSPGQPLVFEPPPIVVDYVDEGTGVDTASLTISVDGNDITSTCVAGPASGSCDPPAILPGLHVLVAEIADLIGNLASTSFEFELREADEQAPALTVTSPVDGALVTTPTIEVRGTVTDDNAVAGVTVDGQDAVVTGDQFSAIVVLAEGDNALSVVASDLAGNETSASLTAALDTRVPRIALTSPADGLVTNEPSVAVVGTVGDVSGVSAVTVNGVPATLAGQSFEAAVTLIEGDNLLTAVATDSAGNEAQVTVLVTLFSVPEVTIVVPADLALLGDPEVDVSGSVTESVVSVEVNGLPATVSGGEFTVTDVPLAEGSNILTAAALDAAGRIGTDSILVARDSTPPRLAFTLPLADSTVFEPATAIAGVVNDLVPGTVNAEQVMVTVNGVPAEVSNRGFAVEALSLTPGLNTLTAVAVDAAGNVGQASIEVERGTPIARVAVSAGNLQTGVVGSLLAQPLEVELLDGAGSPVPGETVVFSVVRSDGRFGDGSRVTALTSDTQGRAAVDYRLGGRAGAGVQLVEASAVGFAGPATFLLSALPGEPSRIVADSGTPQVGVAGGKAPRPLAALVMDADQNRIQGVPVRFGVVEGDGVLDNSLQELVVTTDSDGMAFATLTLDPMPGRANNVVRASVEGFAEIPAASFVASGRAAGDPALTRVTGVVLDNSDLAVPGVTVEIGGTTLGTQTDEQGFFEIAGAPVGMILLRVDGGTAQRPGEWPVLEFTLTNIPGNNNTLGMPIYLLPLDTSDTLFVDETTGGVLTLSDLPGFSLQVAAGSIELPDGSHAGVVKAVPVHMDKVPMTPNAGQQPNFVVTIQPAGAHFDPPAPVAYPNSFGMPPGRSVELMSFDHDLQQFVSIGFGTVSEDGTQIRSDPGVGVVKAGWHWPRFNPGGSNDPGCPHGCLPCSVCVGGVCLFQDGALCDDQDDCTVGDRCRDAGCSGDPVIVTDIIGECIGLVDSPFTFTAQSNAPDKLDWEAHPDGVPPSGEGPSFAVSFPGPGAKGVNAGCEVPSKTKVLGVGDDCASIVASFSQEEVTSGSLPAGAFGKVETIDINAGYVGCVAADEWCFRVTEYTATVSFLVRASDENDITGPDDPKIDAANCQQVIDDLTPPADPRDGGPQRHLWWSRAITEVHERVHLPQEELQKNRPALEAFQTEVAESSNCTDCKSPLPLERFNLRAQEIWQEKDNEFDERAAEVAAEEASNLLYAELVAGIRQRAASEGWACQ